MTVNLLEYPLIGGPIGSGTPLDKNEKDDHLDNKAEIDEFRFKGDELQVKCPFASHIRYVVDLPLL